MKNKQKVARARLLTPMELKMLDVGQPVVVTCKTPSGGSVEVRIQTAVLESENDKKSKKTGAKTKGSWSTHGVYVAVLSDSSDNKDSESTKSGQQKGYCSLPVSQMYRVLRGLPGKLRLTTPEGEKVTITYLNPNAPANRCYETKGLSISFEISGKSGVKSKPIWKELTSKQLSTLRSGKPLDLRFGDRVLTMQSNPGGDMVELPVFKNRSSGSK
jgi:hypothetical protein